MKSLQQQMASIINEYGEELRDAVINATNATAKDTVKYLKSVSPKRTGGYAKGWTVTKSVSNWKGVEATVYNKTKPGLTHLLNDGHAKRGGGRTQGDGHADKADEYAQEKLYDEVLKQL